ncbi:MAG: OsmC family protein [Firmicutes bacterium]|jgi:uncharacterized OsmC-like protein|nr:OsmC family protein [Bacillota bacterium]
MADLEKLTGTWDHEGRLSFVTPDGEHRDGIMRPLEYLLASIIECAGLTIIAMLDKMKISRQGVTIEGTAATAGEKPNYVKSMALSVSIAGAELTGEQLARLSELTEKYCVVAQTLRRTPEVAIEVRTADK